MAKLMLALALVDLAAHNVKAGSLLEADAELIKALKDAGDVDPHKDAVAYAKSQNAPVVRSALDLAAEAAAAQREAALVEIAKLEDLASKAEGESKAAIESQLLAAREALAQLT